MRYQYLTTLRKEAMFPSAFSKKPKALTIILFLSQLTTRLYYAATLKATGRAKEIYFLSIIVLVSD